MGDKKTFTLEAIAKEFAFDGSSWIVNAVNNPEFEKATRVHDWRNYIPDELQKIWFQLGEETRLVAVIMAESRADAEEWN